MPCPKKFELCTLTQVTMIHINVYMYCVTDVHYTSMQALCLLGLHANVQGAGLQCIHACHTGVYMQQVGITYEMPASYKLTPS